jgi:hypothetical protein
MYTAVHPCRHAFQESGRIGANGPTTLDIRKGIMHTSGPIQQTSVKSVCEGYVTGIRHLSYRQNVIRWDRAWLPHVNSNDRR